ncbi:integrase [Bacillus phage vB_BcoS-136]|uniref:Site-specific recombinase n=1 Tax=Bacillus phage vB_BcoS-136 TaxID=2419619 RepID=A0A3G3BW32_9CAUD|nr:integrase [Bacillus phage vB_BcoS-136]AYP68370.1 site-specific recombinase [Bacillus phage vB_BcoS-136]
MTNVKNNPLFNKYRKEEFLEESIDNGVITEETAKNYERIFGITSIQENAIQKDLNDFTFLELETVLRSFKAKNRNTIETYGRIVSSYLNWCVEKGYAKENRLKSLKPDDFEKYIINNEEYISFRKLIRYEGDCANFQDAVILRLLFMGIGGKQMSEIRNLKKSDIDGNRLRLVNTLKEENGKPVKFTERYLTVDVETIDIILGALEQKIYKKRNGEVKQTPTNNVREYTDLIQNDYVIRASITKNDDDWNKPVDKFVIYRRIEVLSETLGINNLTTKFIQRSGMIYLANNLIGKNDNISLDDLKIVADRFNIKSYHNLKGFLNMENIRATYPS